MCSSMAGKEMGLMKQSLFTNPLFSFSLDIRTDPLRVVCQPELFNRVVRFLAYAFNKSADQTPGKASLTFFTSVINPYCLACLCGSRFFVTEMVLEAPLMSRFIFSLVYSYSFDRFRLMWSCPMVNYFNGSSS